MKSLKTSAKGKMHTVILYYGDGSTIYFDDICEGIHDYVNQNGYTNIRDWIKIAVRVYNKR